MITDIDILYNRHLLSRHQIETHYGSIDEGHVFHSNDIFQTVEAFFQIADALQSEKMDFVPLKGPVLSHQIYRDYACRRFYDLDFLVDFDDVERFSRLLVDLGYQPASAWPATPYKKEGLRQNCNEVLFQHRRNGTDVEIHWRLFARYRFPDISFRRLHNEHTIPYALDGRTIRKLSPEMELLFLLIHGATHAWFRIKWLVDVNDYIKNVSVDFDALHDMAAKNGFLKMINYYNAVAEAYIPQACKIPGANRAVPKCLTRYTDKEIQELHNKDLRIAVRKSVGYLAEKCLAEIHLAPDSYSRYRAVKSFLGGALPKNLVRRLEPLDRLWNYVRKNCRK